MKYLAPTITLTVVIMISLFLSSCSPMPQQPSEHTDANETITETTVNDVGTDISDIGILDKDLDMSELDDIEKDLDDISKGW